MMKKLIALLVLVSLTIAYGQVNTGPVVNNLTGANNLTNWANLSTNTLLASAAFRTNAADGSFTNANGGGASVGIGGSINAVTLAVEGSLNFEGGSIFSDGNGVLTSQNFSGGGASLTALNASQLTSGTVPIARLPGVTNFTSYAAGTAYTLTGISTALTFGTTQPVLTINQAGTYLIHSNVGVKYNGATYTAAQTVTFKLRRTNNTAADLTSGSRAVELPVLTTFTGGDVMTLPPIIYTATSGDTVTIFGILSATPAAGSVLADSAELVCIRLY